MYEESRNNLLPKGYESGTFDNYENPTKLILALIYLAREIA